MKKIMFDDHFGLTRAVLEGRKTMTRRFAEKVLVEDEKGFLCWNGEFKNPRYKPGEVVAVAQGYKDAGVSFISCPDPQWGCTRDMPGYNNKMFVRADLMPHQIRITDVGVERLQDISDEDCLAEGVYMRTEQHPHQEWEPEYTFGDGKYHAKIPQAAFAALIDRISGKGTWNRNPWVFVYEFELVK